MDGHTEATTPRHILEVGFAFRKSKALLSAAELGLFTALGDGLLDHDALVKQLNLHGRGARDFFDALVALGLLDRDAQGRYSNTPECALMMRTSAVGTGTSKKSPAWNAKRPSSPCALT